MNDPTAKLLRDVLEAASEIERLLENASLEAYHRDRGLQLITERLLEIVGEALGRLGKSDSIMLTIPNFVVDRTRLFNLLD